MAEEDICFFSIPRISEKEDGERTLQSVVSVECDENLTKFVELFDTKSFYEGKTIADIIIARGAAEFEVTKDMFENEYICKSHQDELYFKWDHQKLKHIMLQKTIKNGPRKPICSFPSPFIPNHGLLRPFTAGCVVSFEESKTFLLKYKILMQTGLPICQEHKNFLKSIIHSPSKEKSSSEATPESSQSSGFIPTGTKTPPAKRNSVVSKEVGDAIINLANVAGISRIAPNKKFQNLTEKTQRKKVATFNSLTSVIAQFMAPDNPQLLLQQIPKTFESKISKQVDILLNQVSEQYLVAANDRERNEVLSQIANSFPLNTLLNYFPFLTRNRYSKARKTAALRQIMWNLPSTIKIKVRYNREFINFFIEFLSSPLVTVGLPFGSQVVKYSSGEKVEIPNTIRKHTANELCLMFDSLMIEIGRSDVRLSRSLKYKLIKICKASKRIATQCVDYYVAEGCEAFEMLHKLIENLLKNELVEESWKRETKYLLQQAEHYLKTDYRIHIKLFSRCADHCISFALSDPNNKKFSSPKCQEIKNHEHEHDLKCDRCLYFPEAVRKIQDILEETFSKIDESSELYDKLLEFKEIIEQCETKIENLKMHILRCVFSDMERESMIKNLKEGEAFITMDYAQKFIPRKSNQPQRDYYAQKGLSWHMSHIFAIVNENLVQNSVTHLMGFEKQSAKTVVTICSDLLQKLKLWQVNVVTFRSDNASNYRNIDLMINLFAMSLNNEIRIKRYSFSEVQNGKSTGDTETSRHKRRMRNSLDAGNNIETPDAMYDALQYGTHPLTAATVVIATVNGKDCDTKKTLNGISKISDFVFDYENKKIRYWQHFNIGNGETITFQDYKALILNAELNISRETSNNPNTDNYIFWRSSYISASETVNESIAAIAEEIEDDFQIDPEDDYVNPQSTAIFFCPINGCQKSFKTYGYLDRHIKIGKHLLVPERCTVQDYALNSYRQCIEGASTSISLPQLPELLENLAEIDETNLKKGWAIRERAARVLHTPDMKTFLDKEFEDSKLKNQRINPKIIQEKMAEIKKENGKLRFKVAERLSSIQIGRYFSAKLNKLRQEEDNENDDAEVSDDLLHDEPMFSDTFEAIFEEIEDWSTLIPPGKEEGEWEDSEEEEEEEEKVTKKKTPKKTTPKMKTPNKKTPKSRKKLQENSPPKENQPPSAERIPSKASRKLNITSGSSSSPLIKSPTSSKRPRSLRIEPTSSNFSRSKKRKS